MSWQFYMVYTGAQTMVQQGKYSLQLLSCLNSWMDQRESPGWIPLRKPLFLQTHFSMSAQQGRLTQLHAKWKNVCSWVCQKRSQTRSGPRKGQRKDSKNESGTIECIVSDCYAVAQTLGSATRPSFILWIEDRVQSGLPSSCSVGATRWAECTKNERK